MSCYFPGNVRELENCVRRTATRAPGDTIQDCDFACSSDDCLSSVLWKVPEDPPSGSIIPLPVLVKPLVPRPNPAPLGTAPQAPAPAADGDASGALIPVDALLTAMEKSGWVQAKAARLLGVTPRQAGYAIRKQGIPSRKF